jgi:hypothetical protein
VYPVLSSTPQAHDDDLARSALPEAPVVADAPRRRPVTVTRAALADVLHATARAVEPTGRPRRSFRTGSPGVCA